jgi:hypothetical protein
MYRSMLSMFLLFVISLSVGAQRSSPPTESELKEITERGRQLAAYEVAMVQATAAVAALKPPEGSIVSFIARKTDIGWQVVFGRIGENKDKFLITYEAIQVPGLSFVAKKYKKPKEDTAFYLFAATAMDTAVLDFVGEKRPYSVAVLPGPSEQLYVYIIPTVVKPGVYPLGGDARYLMSKDGTKIVEKRYLHKSVIEFTSPVNPQQTGAGFHTAVLDDIPEDTDVYHVLSRKPSVPEWVATNQYVFQIDPDGSIKYVTTRDQFLKKGQ